jgi:hypothetical protein
MYYDNEPCLDTISHIIHAVREFSDLHKMLLDSDDFEFSIPFGIVSSDYNMINLEDWIKYMVDKNG